MKRDFEIKSTVPTEHEEQTHFIEWASAYLKKPLSDLLFAIPNGGIRTPRNARTLKKEGVTKGVPDLFFAHPSNGFHGLFIEMKRRDPNLSRLSPQQATMIESLAREGFACSVCFGCLEAIKVLMDYVGDQK